LQNLVVNNLFKMRVTTDRGRAQIQEQGRTLF
jgi:hypothetical protein